MNLQKKKVFLISGIIAFVCLISGILYTYYKNEYRLELSFDEEVTILEYGVDELPEVTGTCFGTTYNQQGVPVAPILRGYINLDKVGTYNVQYVVHYGAFKLSQKHTYIVQDTQAPTIELTSIPDYYTSPVASYVEEGFTATDNYDGDISANVISEEKDGIVTYTVSDSSGNTTTVEREIIYKDVVAPVITLNGGNNTVCYTGSPFADPGYTATDDVDGDISVNVSRRGSVNENVEGIYTLIYDVSDSSNNITMIERTVTVKNSESPSIYLTGDRTQYLEVGATYEEAGFSAYDTLDGDLTSQVAVSGSVDTSKMGLYTLTYSVTDSTGLSFSVIRYIYVYQKQNLDPNNIPTEKVVYLTFDDGPSRFTAPLLDTLDKFGVKATFFVTNQYSAYQNMIAETASRGHTIALHTYSHVFSSVYASLDAYLADLQRIQDVVVAQTGKSASIVRFPGGTSNTISKNYCRGVMTQITNTLPGMGYQYCDWNVDSEDAGSARSSVTVYRNVTNGMKSHNMSIVLQHDTTSYSTKGVEEILAWGIINGYTFLPMTDSTTMYHHPVRN